MTKRFILLTSTNIALIIAIFKAINNIIVWSKLYINSKVRELLALYRAINIISKP